MRSSRHEAIGKQYCQSTAHAARIPPNKRSTPISAGHIGYDFAYCMSCAHQDDRQDPRRKASSISTNTFHNDFHIIKVRDDAFDLIDCLLSVPTNPPQSTKHVVAARQLPHECGGGVSPLAA